MYIIELINRDQGYCFGSEFQFSRKCFQLRKSGVDFKTYEFHKCKNGKLLKIVNK